MAHAHSARERHVTGGPMIRTCKSTFELRGKGTVAGGVRRARPTSSKWTGLLRRAVSHIPRLACRLIRQKRTNSYKRNTCQHPDKEGASTVIKSGCKRVCRGEGVRKPRDRKPSCPITHQKLVWHFGKLSAKPFRATSCQHSTQGWHASLEK